MTPLDRTVNLEGKSVDLVKGGPYGLGALAIIISENEHINKNLRRNLAQGGDFFCASLAPILRKLAELRNPAAHSGSIDSETVHKQRNQYLGVGCEGELVRLAKVTVLP